jgi:hypothetical protein
VLPYRVRRRPEPLAALITWNKIEVIARPSHWHLGDAAELGEKRWLEGPRQLGKTPQETGPAV